MILRSFHLWKKPLTVQNNFFFRLRLTKYWRLKVKRTYCPVVSLIWPLEVKSSPDSKDIWTILWQTADFYQKNVHKCTHYVHSVHWSCDAGWRTAYNCRFFFFKNNITGESFMRICGELLQTGWIRPRLNQHVCASINILQPWQNI